jgi:hypothetical protein
MNRWSGSDTMETSASSEGPLSSRYVGLISNIKTQPPRLASADNLFM